jgi:diacylglycerol kinase
MTQPPIKLRPQSTAEDSSALSNADRRRSPWRRRLVEAERGLTEGFRSDSTLFGHFFIATVVMAAALVFGISLWEWGLLILSFAMVFSTEMFHLAMRAVLRNLNQELNETLQAARRIATAGVFFAILGAVSVIGLIFIPRLWNLISGN